jgi:hypothetical protein
MSDDDTTRQGRTPEGEPIDVHTLWLGFDDGEEGAISIDLTGWNAVTRRLKEIDARHAERRMNPKPDVKV